MEHNIKYYKPLIQHTWTCPLISIEVRGDIVIMGHYYTRPKDIKLQLVTVYGWSYITHTTGSAFCRSFNQRRIEITKEEADREIFLYEL